MNFRLRGADFGGQRLADDEPIKFIL